MKNKKQWILKKKVLPHHTDYAGVMWHGSYINFLEEGRIDALNKVGISYSELSLKGYEIPVISMQINYKLSFMHGETVELRSEFYFSSRIRLNCETLFFKSNGDIGAKSNVELVFVSKKNNSMKLVRELPKEIKNTFILLEAGPEE